MSEQVSRPEIEGKRIETISMDKKTPCAFKLGTSGPTIEVVPDDQSESSLKAILDGEEHPLHMGPNMIGRLEENDIVVSLPTVSRTHAVINVGTEEYSVSDLDSMNGTLVA